MAQISDSELNRLLEDLAVVKATVKKNTSLIKQINYRQPLLPVIWISTIILFGICGTYYLLIKHYGSYNAIPFALQIAMLTAILISILGIGILKNILILKDIKRLNPKYSLFKIIGDLYNLRVYHSFIPAAIVILFVVGFLVFTNNTQYIVPAIAIGAGLKIIDFGAMIHLNEFIITGYWLTATGLFFLIFHSITPLLSIVVSLGGTYILLGILITFSKHKVA